MSAGFASAPAAHPLPAGVVLAVAFLLALGVALAPAGAPLALLGAAAVLGALFLTRLAGAAWPSRREIVGLGILALTAWLLNALFFAGPRAVWGGVVMPWSETGAREGVDTAIRLLALVLVFRAAVRGLSAREALALAGGLPSRVGGGSLGVLLLVALRLAPSLGEEARRLQWQRALRGDWPGPSAPRAERERRLRVGVRDLSAITLPLFLLALARAEELAWALPARYYGLAKRTPPERVPWRAVHGAVIAGAAGLAAIAAWARWGR